MSRMGLYIVPFGLFCDSRCLENSRLCVSSIVLQRVCLRDRAFPHLRVRSICPLLLYILCKEACKYQGYAEAVQRVTRKSD